MNSVIYRVRSSEVFARLRDERGSLSILTFSLFLLLAITSFLILNASSAYLAKRELVQIGEIALTRAAHNLDQNSYYNQGGFFSTSPFPNQSSGTMLPIDCSKAFESFTNEISNSRLRDSVIGFSAWQCDGKDVAATLTSQIRQLLSIPFLNSIFSADGMISLTAPIATQNRLQN